MGKRGLSANNAQFVSVDLIGEKNQVILEYVIKHISLQHKVHSNDVKVYRAYNMPNQCTTMDSK